MPNRFEQLDSLRGLAALSVVLCHGSNLVPSLYEQSDANWWLTHTPLNAIRAGGAAVIFFFVLSGFVLAIPYWKGSAPNYPAFAVRRIARIWLPYLVATVLAIVMAVNFYSEPVPAYGEWNNRPQTWPTWTEAIQHLTLISSFDNNRYNPVVWSLVQELRISLFFPVMVWAVRKYDWRYVLIGAFALSWVGTGLGSVLRHWGYASDYPIMLHYASLFLVGILLARHVTSVTQFWGNKPRWAWWVVGAFALACYTHGDWLRPAPRILTVAPGHDWLVMVGVVIFIVFGLTPSGFSNALLRRPLVFLGKISYSLYLYHAIILLSVSHSLYGILPLWGIWSVTLVLSVLVATIGFYLVEKPCISLGYRLAEKVQRSKPAVRPSLATSLRTP